MNFINTDAFAKFAAIVLLGDFIALLLNVCINVGVTNHSRRGDRPTQLLILAYPIGILAAIANGWANNPGLAPLLVAVSVFCAVAIWPLTLWRLVVTPTRH